MSGRRVLDLFCGAGGLTSGFAKSGFDVTGVDHLDVVSDIFSANQFGVGRVKNLYRSSVNGGYDLVLGGPPCRPWSVVNTTRRRHKHGSFRFLARFASHVLLNHPRAFLMENVPPARPDVLRVAKRLTSRGYDVEARVVRYSDFGAPSSRRRLILHGSRKSDAKSFFEELDRFKTAPTTVRAAIGHLSGVEYGAVADHVYPGFQTIENYMDYYETGKYGWYRLAWDKPAPSFGNVVKTYTLHPSSWEGAPPRVISVREALLLMGFDRGFVFPSGMGVGRRYQMVADSVSPTFSLAAARAIEKTL